MSNFERENPADRSILSLLDSKFIKVLGVILFTIIGVDVLNVHQCIKDNNRDNEVQQSTTTRIPTKYDHPKYDVFYIFVLDESGSMRPSQITSSLLDKFKKQLIKDVHGIDGLVKSKLSSKDFDKLLFAYLICSSKSICENNSIEDINKYQLSVYSFGANIHKIDECQKINNLDLIINKVLSDTIRESHTNLLNSFDELIAQLNNHYAYPPKPFIISITIVSDFAHDTDYDDESYEQIAKSLEITKFNRYAQIQFNLLKLPTDSKPREIVANKIIQRIKEKADLNSRYKIFVYDDFLDFMKKMEKNEEEEEVVFIKKWLRSIYKPVILSDSLYSPKPFLLINPSASIIDLKSTDFYIASLFPGYRNKDTNAKINLSIVAEGNPDRILMGPRQISINGNRHELFQISPKQEILLQKNYNNPNSNEAELFLKVDPCDFEYQYLYPLRFSVSEN